MKNPLEQIKHLVKDPINTIPEAEARKKEIMPWLYGSIALAVVPSVLGGAISALSFLTIFGMIGIFATMFFAFLLFVIKKAKDRFKALTCNQCNTMAEIKTPEDFTKYVSYVAGANQAVYGGVSHPASNNGVVSEITASAKATVQVAIDLKCPHCGASKKLQYTIVPFKCSAKETKIAVRDVELVKTRIGTAVQSVVTAYNDPEQREKIGYTIHSKHNPKYDQRSKPTMGNDTVAYPRYNGVKIDYHKDVDEMVTAFFLENQLDGNLKEV